jgi:hypothetical protein
VVKLENTGIIKQMYDVAIYEPTHPCTGSECKNVDHSFMANGILTANSFRMPVFGIDPASTITYQSIDNANRDMEFQYLSDNNARSILSAFQMSPDELPGWSYLSKGTNSQALSESNNQYQLESAKDVGFRPLLKQFEDFLNARIFPLIDKPLSKVCTFKFVGLDAENPDQEIARLQQNSQLHLTYNDILTKVEKKEIPKELGGDVPLNPQYQAILDKYLTVGQIKEIYFGIKGASKNPNFDYMRDPFYFQQQMLLAQRAMIPSNPRVNSPLPPNAEPPETEGYELGGNNQVQPENEQSLPQLSGPEIKEMQVNQSGKPNDSEADEIYSEVHHPFERSADQAMYALKKAEAQLPPSKRKVLQHQKELIQSFVDSWEKDLATATNEVSKIANRFLPKSK